MLHLDSQCSAGFSNLVLPWLSRDGIQRKKKKGRGKKKKKACVVYQILALPLAGSEMKGLLSCLPQQHPQSCLPQGGLFFLKCPGSFMMTPPFIMNTCCFGPKLSLFFFLFSLPFKFGFKCAHMTLTRTSSVPPVNRRLAGGREVEEGSGRGLLAVSCVNCSVPAAFEGLQISLPPSEHRGIEGCFEMWQALSAYVHAGAMKHKNLFPYQSG